MLKYFDESLWHCPFHNPTNEDQAQQINRKLFYISSHCLHPDVHYFQEFYFAQPCSHFVPHILFYIHVKKFALLFTPPATMFLLHIINNGPPT